MTQSGNYIMQWNVASPRLLSRAVLLGIVWAGMLAQGVRAEEVTVAVAANFVSPMRALETEFEAATGHRVVIASGSTGQFYAQIVNGAPFDVLLAADQRRPHLLASEGLGDPSSVFTYAIGRLALWSRQPGRVDEATLTTLLATDFRWFAIAEPDVAPYGAAARQVLENLGLRRAIGPRIVTGQNVAQTFAFLQTGNAEIGLIALSQALAYEGPASYAVIPDDLHAPIRQDAIVLRRAADNPAAAGLLEYLRGPAAAAIIERYGYGVARDPIDGPRRSSRFDAAE